MTATWERTTYVCDDTSMSILPIEDVLTYGSIDNIYTDCSCDDYSLWCECITCGPVYEILDDVRYDPGYEALMESIKTRGMVKGIRIHPTVNRVVDGHHRIAACLDLGFKFIPVESHVMCETGSGAARFATTPGEFLL
jgi:hypothetical protein